MNTYLFSIHPKWCEKIFNGEKTIEVRKIAPKPPFKVVVYCTKDKCGKIGKPSPNYNSIAIWQKTFCPPTFIEYGGKVIGEFICDKIEQLQYQTTIPCIKINENDELEISGNTAVEPFYNGKAKTIKESCLTQEQLLAYGQDKTLYALHITAPKLYDKPRELGEFRTVRFVRGYHKKNETMTERLKNSKRVEVTYVSKAPQNYMRIQDPKEEI